MKIDENTINHNALRLINLAKTGVVDEENSDRYMIVAFNYIKGICDMANAMKEVLKKLRKIKERNRLSRHKTEVSFWRWNDTGRTT